jgi:nitrite reductase (NADH) large subunit
MSGRRTLVIVGHGMVGHKLVQALLLRDAGWEIVVFGEEPRPAYDRVHLSALFDGATADELSLVGAEMGDPAVDASSNDPVVAIDRSARTVTTRRGRVQRYEVAVLATGSLPFVPPVPGRDLPGCFVYRTIEDVEAIRAWANSKAAGRRRGVVVGGGLLGLEAAKALRGCNVETELVEVAPRLMSAQVDDVGGRVLQGYIEALGVRVRVATTVEGIESGPDGAVAAVSVRAAGEAQTAERFATDMVVFSAGVRPRDELARECRLEIGERGGVVVDAQCRTSDPSIFAIGECASVAGRVYGLVSPGYQMARVVADTLSGHEAAFAGADLSTNLKLLGVQVASFGDAHATTVGSATISYTDHPGRVHKRLVIGHGGQLLGGLMVGDTAGYETLAQMARGELPTPERPATLIVPAGAGPAGTIGVDALPEAATVCSCENVNKGAICSTVASLLADTGAADIAAVKKACRAGTGCGACVPQLTDLVRTELARAGVAVTDHLCEHFPYSRQELFDVVRVENINTFSALVAAHGTGRGCEICKPAVASILASLQNRYVLDADLAGLQDTNDHFLANLQRDGTYSVVPRVPGGEITPEKLIVLGSVARDFGLYTKITGGQRIDLFGARVEQLPAIWTRLVDAGFESGHAYGKALRTVKSCVGTTWCRYGVQDSTTLAIALELRYRGLRSPHKIKMGVSGCARECAEAQAKDVGVIATERGWNLYVCGNGGTRPRHADLLAEDLDTDTLIRTIDRFLIFYIRTADRLQRTASWLEHLDGSIAYLRRVIIDDAIGLGAELDGHMAQHVANYQCEWKTTLDDPKRLARFRTFVNSDDPDPDIVFVTERGQHRPAREWEKVDLVKNGR